MPAADPGNALLLAEKPASTPPDQRGGQHDRRGRPAKHALSGERDCEERREKGDCRVMSEEHEQQRERRKPCTEQCAGIRPRTIQPDGRPEQPRNQREEQEIGPRRLKEPAHCARDQQGRDDARREPLPVGVADRESDGRRAESGEGAHGDLRLDQSADRDAEHGLPHCEITGEARRPEYDRVPVRVAVSMTREQADRYLPEGPAVRGEGQAVPQRPVQRKRRQDRSTHTKRHWAKHQKILSGLA